MSEPTKLRESDSPLISPLTLLKELWRSPSFAESRDYWREQFDSRRTQAAIRKEIRQKHNIHLRFDKQLTHFRRWVTDQDLREQQEEEMEEDCRRIQKLFPDATEEEIRKIMLRAFQIRALARGEVNLGKFVLRHCLADRKLSFHQKQALRAERKQEEKALDLCLEETRDFPDARQQFKSAFDALRRARQRPAEKTNPDKQETEKNEGTQT